MKKKEIQPIDEDLKQVWVKLSQIYQALNEATQDLKRLAAVKENANGKK